MYGNPQLLTSGYDFHGSPHFCYATWRFVLENMIECVARSFVFDVFRSKCLFRPILIPESECAKSGLPQRQRLPV